MSSTIHNAAAQASTAAERGALVAVRRASREAEGPIEWQCVRAYAIACEPAAKRGLEIDRQVLVVAALSHDLGLHAARERPLTRQGIFLR